MNNIDKLELVIWETNFAKYATFSNLNGENEPITSYNYFLDAWLYGSSHIDFNHLAGILDLSEEQIILKLKI